jgi:hypothetical protein
VEIGKYFPNKQKVLLSCKTGKEKFQSTPSFSGNCRLKIKYQGAKKMILAFSSKQKLKKI